MIEHNDRWNKVQQLLALCHAWLVYIAHYNYCIFVDLINRLITCKENSIIQISNLKGTHKRSNSICHLINNYVSLLAHSCNQTINTYSRAKCIRIRSLVRHDNNLLLTKKKFFECLSLNSRLNSSNLLCSSTLTTVVSNLLAHLNSRLVTTTSHSHTNSGSGILISTHIAVITLIGV